MTTVWIALVLSAGAIILFTLASWRHRVEMTDLGTVSEHWLAEQRANERHHAQR